MRIFAENENNDIFLGANNKISILTGLEAIIQAARAAVEKQLGEAVYSKLEGIPTDRAVWSGTPDLPQFEYYVRKQLAAVPGVTGVDSYSTAVEGAVLNYSVTINTIHGQGTINGTV